MEMSVLSGAFTYQAFRANPTKQDKGLNHLNLRKKNVGLLCFLFLFYIFGNYFERKCYATLSNCKHCQQGVHPH